MHHDGSANPSNIGVTSAAPVSSQPQARSPAEPSGAGDTSICSVVRMADGVIYVKWWIANWVDGTNWMTRLERGAYHDLLMHQASNGPFSDAMAKRILSTDYDIVWPVIHVKFKRTQDGLLYNDKMHREATSIREYSKSRSCNRKGKRKMRQKDMSDTSSSYEPHMGSGSGNSGISASKAPDVQRAAMCPHLTRLYAAYPKKAAKTAVYRTWAQLIADGHDPQELADKCIATVEKYKRSEQWIKGGGKFIPELASFLEKGRWDDQPVEYHEEQSDPNDAAMARKGNEYRDSGLTEAARRVREQYGLE